MVAYAACFTSLLGIGRDTCDHSMSGYIYLRGRGNRKFRFFLEKVKMCSKHKHLTVIKTEACSTFWQHVATEMHEWGWVSAVLHKSFCSRYMAVDIYEDLITVATNFSQQRISQMLSFVSVFIICSLKKVLALQICTCFVLSHYNIILFNLLCVCIWY